MLLPSVNSNRFLHLNSIAHEGKIVVFGTTTLSGQSDTGQIWYTVRQDGFEDSYLNQTAEDRTGWEDWRVLQLPNEKEDDPSVVERETSELTDKKTGEFIMRSVYRSRDRTAVGPVQLVSALGHIYVFRQSKENTLLVDRFVLDGMTNELVCKLDVRFKRSRQKYVPYQKTDNKKKGTRISLTQVDTLDFQDTDGKPFHEPTTELCLIKNLVNGWFSVVLVPTNEHDHHRWHIFACTNTDQVEMISLRSSEEGLFDVRDRSGASGIIRRRLNLTNKDNGKPLKPMNGLAAAKYDVQKEETVKEESQFVKEATRILLAIPTNDGNTAALSFGLAADGTLAQIDEGADPYTWRADEREVMLPLNTLDEIKAIGDSSPAPQGIISKLGSGVDDRVVVASDQVEGLAWNNTVEIKDTTDYNGHYLVDEVVDQNTFMVVANPNGIQSLGSWKLIEEETSGLAFDGIITAYESSDGRLRVTCENHGLGSDDEVEVQIVGTTDYNAVYRVANVKENEFTIERKWQPGEAVNVIRKAKKRRGIQFDGEQDHVEIPHAPELSLDNLTIEAWVNPDETQGINNAIVCKLQDGKYNYRLSLTPELKITLNCYRRGGGDMGGWSRRALKPGVWNHIAVTWNSDTGTETIYLNGEFDYREGNTSGGLMQNSGPLLIGKGVEGQGFSGKIADVRIWERVRTEKEIKDSMYLQLTGMETGLVGYWRLGAIAEDLERKVVDFSVNGLDGVVHGNAFVSEVSRERKLSNGLNAIQYSNSELFAVSQGATYEESFEFRLTGSVENPTPPVPDNLFKFSYWGKKNRNSEKRIPEDPMQDNPFIKQEAGFVKADNGWYTASCRFTVPDGVSLVRLFEISLPDDLGGEWDSIEIRKHRIQLKSNSVTEAQYTDVVTLPMLGGNQAALRAALNSLEAADTRVAVLQGEKRRLEDELADLNRSDAMQALERAILGLRVKKASAEKVVTSLQTSIAGWDWEESLERAQVVMYANPNFTQPSKSLGLGIHHINVLFSSITVPSGITVEVFRQWRQANEWYESATYPWRTITYTGYTSLKAEPQTWGRITITKSNPKSRGYTLQFILGEKSKVSNLKNSAQNTLNQLNKDLAVKEKEKQNLEQAKKDTQALLDAVIAELNPLATSLAKLNADFLKDVAPQAALPMEDLFTVKGLTTQGALLGFVRPASRLSAMETCEGNVQLSYFDDQGQMRQTNYDAAADSGGTFEQWIPDALRSCLNFNKISSVVKLENSIILEDDWTIEAWFSYPLLETPNRRNTLVAGKEGDCHILFTKEQGTERLGIHFKDRGFFDSGCDTKQLSPGWHHIAAVGREDTTLFYLDGVPAGDTKAKALADARRMVEEKPNDDQAKKKVDDIKNPKTMLKVSMAICAIGNLQKGGEPVGKLAEVRIWGGALSEEEIAVNSKTLLTGNEPGLLAHYPMSEAKQLVIADRTGNTQCTIEGASAWGCAAPIGNLGHRVMQLDGLNDQLVLPELEIDFSPGMTVEMWVRFNSFKNWTRLIDFSNAGSADWIYLCEADSPKTLQFGFVPGAGAGSTWAINALNVLELGQWIHLAATINNAGIVTLYKNGQQIQSGASGGVPSSKKRTKNFIGKSDLGNVFDGQVADVRLWNKARSQAEIKAAMNRRLTGQEPGLAGYWPLNELNLKGEIIDLIGDRHGSVTEALMVSDNTLPIVGDAVISAEYSAFGQEAETGKKSSMMRRFLAAPTSRGIQVLPDKRIEMLDLKWIGNGQFDPTLLGYIEGAPPLPSENLTVEGNYNGATSVELTMAENVDFQWNREQEAGLGASAELFIGVDQEVKLTKSAGAIVQVGMEEKALEVRKGFSGNLSKVYSNLNSSSITASSGTAVSDRLELHGTQEETAKFPHLGQRFIPKNIGYALVVSGIADIFITRLRKSGRMISYVVLPVPEIPPDVNTITFLINPAYTMQGSLDGMTGSGATSQRFFKHVPEMRAQYGALYPASYYRLKETYALKEQIEYRDKRREAYFRQFDARLLASPLGNDSDMDREVENAEYYTGAATVGQPDASAQLDAEINALKEQIKTLESKKGRSQAENAELIDKQSEVKRKEEQKQKALDDKIDQLRKPASGSENSGAEQKRSEIDKQISNVQQAVHATESLARWQKKMEHIQILAGKRNIANTYVWDADGGMHSESQQFANTIEHMIGGSFSHEGAAGGGGGFKAFGTGFELTALVTANLTQTMSKTETRSKAFELNVDVSGVESTGITDYNDHPIQPGEKVDRYRFMSFYLEGSTENFNSFFNEVVDPEWLASNDEEARALRQAKGKANKTWRVFHRVTYVERPALMGFGRDLRSLTKEEEMPDNKQLQNQIEELKANNEELNLKIDRILTLLNPGVISDSDGNG